MIKHFLSTLAAVLLACGIVYGVYEWKQARDYREVLASEALREMAKDVEEVGARTDRVVDAEYHLATLRRLTERRKSAEEMLAKLRRVGADSDMIAQQERHTKFLRETQDWLVKAGRRE